MTIMKRSGFTLVELLVVIASIATLMGVLAPALGAARQQTRGVVCESNIKQLALALTMYEQEMGTFPHGFVYFKAGMVAPPGGWVGNPSYDNVGWWWFHFLAGTLGEDFGEESVLRCPSRSVRDPGLMENILCGNYGVNRPICVDSRKVGNNEFFGRPLGQNRIRRPTQTLLIVDSGYSLISWRGATDGLSDRFENSDRVGAFYVPGLRINEARLQKGTISQGHEQDAINGRHPNKTVNVGFADGHIAHVEADDLLVEEIGGGSYRNRSPLWLPNK